MKLSWSGQSRFTWIAGAPWTFYWGRGFCQKRQIFTGFYLVHCLLPCLNRTHVLQKIGITAVLNTAEGPWSEWGFVDLSPSHYQGSGIHYQVYMTVTNYLICGHCCFRDFACGTLQEPQSSRTLDLLRNIWTSYCRHPEERLQTFKELV